MSHALPQPLTRFEQLAPHLATCARLLRDAVTDALALQGEVLGIRDGLKKLLFPEATDAQFADAYAQTTLFGFLLARAQGADVNDLNAAYAAISSDQTLLDHILQGLTNPGARQELGPALAVAQRMVAAIGPELLVAKQDETDPWLFFYEDFLAAYDPKLRKQAGAYYTPVQVVRCQVRLAEEVLREELRRPNGFLDTDVSILDPAVGTGTYLLAIIDRVVHAARTRKLGEGAVPSAVGDLVQRLFGFEIMVGPYAVAQVRLAQSVRAYGSSLPAKGGQVFLTNTLEDPQAPPPDMPLWGINKQISMEHARALTVKDQRRILVILGNPPYGRHDQATAANRAVTGAWVRWGRDGKGTDCLMADFTRPAKAAGHGRHLKNLYNLYVYFIRWALWKAFEHGDAKDGPGIVSFITASSYLDGEAFAGLREHLRRECDEIRILDLGGEGRGTHQDENVFDIQTPVAIFVAWRRGAPSRKTEARVRYARIGGTRVEKFARLEAIQSRTDVEWEALPKGWQAPFRPSPAGAFAAWPRLTDLMPWQHSGAQFKRTWPIAPDADTLRRRWRALLHAPDRAAAFRETRDRKVGTPCPEAPPNGNGEQALASLPPDAPEPLMVRYAFRSFDRQWAFADHRLGDFLRPGLWSAHSERQLCLSALFTAPLGPGPALTVSAYVPDLHCFRGSFGAADQFPLYRDRDCTSANVVPGLLALLGTAHRKAPSPEAFAGYLYGVLAHPAYQARHAEALLAKELRVPLTKDSALFTRAARIGRRLLWLHTYGERFADDFGELPPGSAQCHQAPTGRDEDYPDTFAYDEASREIIIGEGRAQGRFGPVAPEVWAFAVSGFRVVQSWLGYRMKNRKGKKSSPLDDLGPTEWTWDFTMEFLQLLAVLEHTLAGYPEQAELLAAIEAGPLFVAADLPPVPPGARGPLGATPLLDQKGEGHV